MVQQTRKGGKREEIRGIVCNKVGRRLASSEYRWRTRGGLWSGRFQDNYKKTKNLAHTSYEWWPSPIKWNGILPPPQDKTMDISNFTFDDMRNKIV